MTGRVDAAERNYDDTGYFSIQVTMLTPKIHLTAIRISETLHLLR